MTNQAESSAPNSQASGSFRAIALVQTGALGAPDRPHGPIVLSKSSRPNNSSSISPQCGTNARVGQKSVIGWWKPFE